MIVVFGTICLDRIRLISELPKSGGYAEVQGEHLMLGGEAANTASALTHWGAKVRLAGNHFGTGSDGQLLRQMLDKNGLAVERSGKEPAVKIKTPVCDIYVAEDGDRTMFGYGFKSMDADLDALPLDAEAWFTADPNLGSPAREAARLAQAAGLKCYLMDFLKPDDPVRAGDFWQSSTDWVGTRGNMQKNVAWVKRFVADRGCFAVLSDGPNGFVAGSPEHPVRAYPPFPAPSITDSTGAGDAFRAGMLLGLDSGSSIGNCLRFASAAGSLSCGFLGGSTSSRREEIEEFVKLHQDVSRQYGE